MNMNRKFYHDKHVDLAELPDSRDFDPLQFVVGNKFIAISANMSEFLSTDDAI